MQLTRITGPKTIVWITMGAPNRVAYPFGCRDVAFAGESGSYLAGKCRDGCAYLRGNQCIDYTPFLGHFSRELERTGTIFSSVEELAAGSLSLSNVAGSSEDTLRQLASLTGGHMYSSGEVEKAITQSLDGARARYQLAYHAPPANGKYHKVHVVSSRKRIRIQAQQGYYANQP